MRVGFDLSVLRPSNHSLARVADGLLTALERRGVLEVVRFEPPQGTAARHWRQRELPRLAASTGVSGLHALTSGYPFFGPGRRVQTIHELPWRHGVRENAGLAHRFWAGLGTARADAILVPSEHVARDLRGALLVRARKLQVVPFGVAPGFQVEPPPGQIDEVVLARYRLSEEPFLLCPGAVRPKKNLAAVLYALAERKSRGLEPLTVLVTGRATPQLRADLGLASRLGLARWVQTLDEVAAQDLPALYRLAAAVPVLSHSEGFSFPTLEALASGTPVLVSRASAQAELAGEAGLAVDPASPGEVGTALERARRERAHLRRLGLERARAFTWERTAERVEAVWQALA